MRGIMFKILMSVLVIAGLLFSFLNLSTLSVKAVSKKDANTTKIIDGGVKAPKAITKIKKIEGTNDLILE